jgi:hypothetical protein
MAVGDNAYLRAIAMARKEKPHLIILDLGRIAASTCVSSVMCR